MLQWNGLNAWYRVSYRILNQWVRRQFWKCFPRQRGALLWELARISHPQYINDSVRERIGKINWMLGRDSYYRFTPAQIEQQVELTRQIVAQLKKEGKLT